jgi:hypothetical protein
MESNELNRNPHNNLLCRNITLSKSVNWFVSWIVQPEEHVMASTPRAFLTKFVQNCIKIEMMHKNLKLTLLLLIQYICIMLQL